MKRLLSLTTTLLMAVASFAYDACIDGIYYNLSGSEATVTYSTKSSVYKNNRFVYKNSVNIPETVTYKNKTYSVTAIGESAFIYCDGLTKVTIPKSVTSIGHDAFYDCTNLKDINIPEGITIISNAAFYNCSSLTNITIPESVTIIDGYAFNRCASIQNIKFPSKLSSIGNYAFFGCTSLTNISIPSSVTSLGDKCAFGSCPNLERIEVDANNKVFDSRENCNAIIDKQTNMLLVGCKNTTIPSSVRSISDAFYDCYYLTNIVLPENLKTIWGNAFYGCSRLTSITIPEGVTSIGHYAFQYCKGLTSITIPSSVTEIGIEAFHGCYGLTNVTIHKGVKKIWDRAFYFCEDLRNITIPSSVTSIGSEAFKYCKSLRYIYSYISSPTSSTGSNFDSSNYTNATLYVPRGTKALYQNTDGWKNFQYIVEFDASAVQEISGEETEAKIIGNYSIDGKRLAQPLNGLNLQKLSNGKTIKIINR